MDDVVTETLLREAVQELSPRVRKLIARALDEAIPAAAGVPQRLLQALVAALAQPDPAQSAAPLRAEGSRWAAEDRSVAVLAEEAIQALRILGAHLRPLLLGEEDQAEGVRLAFLSEVLAGYVQAREEIAAQRRATDLSARMSELAALHKVISAANSSLDLDATLHLVVRNVAEVMQVDVCELYLFEPDRDTLLLGASVGLNPEAEGRLRIPLGEGVTGWAAQQGRPVAVADVRQEPRFLYEPLLQEDPYRSLLSVPIILYTQEELVGVINLRTRDVRTYSADEIKFLETVAGEMAISLENARLYQETDERLRQKVVELTTLQRVSAMVASTLELDKTLGLIAEQAARLGQADMAAIVEWSSPDHEPGVVAHWGLAQETAGHLQRWLRHGEVYARIAAADRAVTLHADDATEPGRQAAETGLHLLLCIPLRGKEGLLGTIGLRTGRPEGFAPEQIDLLTVFADQAAMAIENARLYEELRRSLEIKSTLLQEMHHRVRNNLQAVASLLNMQMRREPSLQVARSLEESASRIQSIAVVHDLLCQENLGVTTVQAVARQVLEVARSHLARPGLELRCQIVDESPLPIGSKEATLLALLVNELFSNAIAHGLAGQEHGTVVVDAYLADGRVVLQVKDDGQGPVPGENSEGGLGLQIIRALVTRDLGGTFALQRDGDWTVAIVSFPYRQPKDLGESPQSGGPTRPR